MSEHIPQVMQQGARAKGDEPHHSVSSISQHPTRKERGTVPNDETRPLWTEVNRIALVLNTHVSECAILRQLQLEKLAELREGQFATRKMMLTIGGVLAAISLAGPGVALKAALHHFGIAIP